MTCAKEQSHSRCIHDSVGLEVEAHCLWKHHHWLSKKKFSLFLFIYLFIFMNKNSFHIETKLGDFLQLINNESCKTTFGIPSPW